MNRPKLHIVVTNVTVVTACNIPRSNEENHKITTPKSPSRYHESPKYDHEHEQNKNAGRIWFISTEHAQIIFARVPMLFM